MVEFAGTAHTAPTPWNCPCGQLPAVVITQCVPVVFPYAEVFGGRQHAPTHGLGTHEVCPGRKTRWPVMHCEAMSTTHPPSGSQHAPGHGLGLHEVNGPCHSPVHASGLVYEQTEIVPPVGVTAVWQHAPPHGYGLHAVIVGM